MWGNLVTETAFLTNFTLGFPTKQSDVLLHLTHWQYWFWFWFTYYMVLYYFIFLRLIRYRTLKMSPRLNTSFRSHGKWGDLLVCFIPLSWCANILSNSNFILRMIEWQSESSLFTLRIRGKQWYWVYKFELRALADINNTAVNMGSNFWAPALQAHDYKELGFIQMQHTLADQHAGWELSGGKQHVSELDVFAPAVGTTPTPTQRVLSTSLSAPAAPVNRLRAPAHYLLNRNYAWLAATRTWTPVVSSSEAVSLQTYSGLASTVSPEVTRINKVSTSAYTPARLIKGSDGVSVTAKYPTPASFITKPVSNNFYLVVKQKRYLPATVLSGSSRLDASLSLTPRTFDAISGRSVAQDFAVRSANLSLQSNRRLLRTKRVLVVPAHTNITLITNSFDVMHSWYIPGLGVKLDCVPGRSTHHTIHIDHAGFYYGQCAEICGRYHHHMPIRVCALPFEHFLIWWYHYGAPFFFAGNKDRKRFITSTPKQVNW